MTRRRTLADHLSDWPGIALIVLLAVVLVLAIGGTAHAPGRWSL